MHGGSLDDRLFPLANGASARLALLGVPPQPAPLAWNVRLRIGVEIASALEYLHSVQAETHKPQVFHRDVKPANVLLDADLHVRLGDVGLARALAEGGTHITTQVSGTPGFIDQYYQTTHHFDASCDGFSFGVVLLMLLTGRGRDIERILHGARRRRASRLQLRVAALRRGGGAGPAAARGRRSGARSEPPGPGGRSGARVHHMLGAAHCALRVRALFSVRRRCLPGRLARGTQAVPSLRRGGGARADRTGRARGAAGHLRRPSPL
ncbi:kinase-like domain-containing protein, partial [Baffinella frigidus]